jgi:hypothetical protein
MSDDKAPMTFEAVLKEEEKYLGKSSRDAAALCISGGGIRSASFALGVLQGLADKRLLSCFDYLSTVSGGGYIGGWLSAWIHRQSKSVSQVEQAMKSTASPEAEEIFHLRRYTHYLTPKLGLLSSDTWSLISIFIRNLLLNWLMLVPFLFAVLMLPRLFVGIVKIAPALIPFGRGMLFAAILIVLALLSITNALIRDQENAVQQRLSFFFAALFVIVAAILIPLSFHDVKETANWMEKLSFFCPNWIHIGCIAVAIFVIYLLTWQKFRSFAHIIRFTNAFFLSGALLAFEMGILARYVIPRLVSDPLLFVCFASPLYILAFVLSGYLAAGLTHFDLDDMHREWLSSLGGWLLMYALIWSASSVLVLWGPNIFYAGFYVQTLKAPQWIYLIATYGSSFGALISAILTARASHSKDTSSGRRDKGGLSRALKFKMTIFILLLVLLLARFADTVMVLIGAFEGEVVRTHRQVLENTEGWKLLAAIAVLIFASVVFSRYISINKFSLHAMYRNRLIRAYLGASHKDRHPNPVTGFDPDDNLFMKDLAEQKPLHVINMALNLVGGDELAWQERKAESYTASAYHVGVETPLHKLSLGYRSAASYGGTTDGPISLGTAMAISGAAASPNMGYASSPILTFLMTLFNVRLGWWLGNPGKGGEGNTFIDPAWRRSGPDFGLTYLLAEAFGLTNDRRRFVNLSDGGHFENLALYEMIRRKCRYILVIDGDCDKMLNLEDLGNAIRKCRIDFGAEIDFATNLNKLVQRRCRWAKAKITYADHTTGELLFLKPLMFEVGNADEPPDVQSYHKSNPDFPHETTADQFFSESQFESYRRLGLHTMESMNLPNSVKMAQLFAVKTRDPLAAEKAPRQRKVGGKQGRP